MQRMRKSWILLGAVALCAWATSSSVDAAQIDIAGPAGSVTFGTYVVVLPNGNIVVVDPNAPPSEAGAVYLYSPEGSLISTLSGSTPGDHVGSKGVVSLGNGNFVIVSPQWSQGKAAATGAVTWVNGTTGLHGVISAHNSLVGKLANDSVGSGGVFVLANHNYVVSSTEWDGTVGAATWGSGTAGVSGAVSANNSLVGSLVHDRVSERGVAVLANGNYVVKTDSWNNWAGAATWGSGTAGIVGEVSSGNSLVGSAANDGVGFDVTALTNGNYVVATTGWNGGRGAATWGNGATGISGPVSAGNSLVGEAEGDYIDRFVTALTNGNYVVASSGWNGGVGAVTWCNGTTGLSGTVPAANSLVGSAPGDFIGLNGVTALSNGNYVIASPRWGGLTGAATWVDGATSASGVVSAANSLVGSAGLDAVGDTVIALSNGNYVVASPRWNGHAGAATWGSGTIGVSGTVSASNSLVGSGPTDAVGYYVTALSNGNYVVTSRLGLLGVLGAATWGSGIMGVSGTVSASNSLVGSAPNDYVGVGGVTALSNGNYVVSSYYWNSTAGAATWGNGTTGLAGIVSAANSLVGTSSLDLVSHNGVTALSDGNYVVASPDWHLMGAVTLANGAFRLAGGIQPWNSVIGAAAGSGLSMVWAYDPVRKRLAVGRPADNIVSLFTMDQVFADSFE